MMRSRKINLLLALISFAFTIQAQETTTVRKSIYFETAKYTLTEESKSILGNLADSLKKIPSCSIFIKGNTDNIGDSSFNKKLSEQRVLATTNYLVEKGIARNVFSTSALGETKPVGDNTTEEGKHRNRRVDISVSFAVAGDSAKFLTSIFTLYRKTERKPQEFSINPARDTVLRCEKGTVVYVKANTFKIPPAFKSRLVTIRIKEDFLKSDMILDNLSTTSNGKLLETQGMVYTEAVDYKGNKLVPARGKDLVVAFPAEKIVPGAKIFRGNRTAHDSIMNWTVNNSSVLSGFSLVELNCCHEWICGGSQPCPFFFCKIRRFFRKILGRQNRNPVTNPPPKEMIPKCEMLAKLYKDYNVTDLAQLTYALNKPLLDSFRVKTIPELQDTLRKLNLAKVELSYLNKTLNYEDYKFYIYNTSRLGWSNVDVFADVKPEQMATLKVNLEAKENIDCKLVFKNRRFVVPATKEDKKYEFSNVPKDEPVWILALKYDNGKPLLSLQENSTGNKTVDVDFKELSLEELKEKLKLLDGPVN